jgi:7-carboxy-7-deazaguanine synthase (Cx14CxxC type)
VSRNYSVKECFYTLQGEGAQTGRPAVFLRFAGCNLWSGREADRAAAICDFCDTNFVGMDGSGGGRFADARSLAAHARARWPLRTAGVQAGPDSAAPEKCAPEGARSGIAGKPYVVCTGGEPLLQIDEPLIDALHTDGFEIGVETNGTIAAPAGLDWICVSPKADAPLAQLSGDELKLVFPQAKAMPERFETLAFAHFFLQPMDGPSLEANTRAALAYCLEHPLWRLSLQTHKLLGIP